MANTGIVWADYLATQLAAADWTAKTTANDADASVSDAIDASGYSNVIISVSVLEATGAIDGVVTIAILQDIDGTVFEDAPVKIADIPQVGSPWQFTMTPIASDATARVFSLNVANYDVFKIAVLNESGQSLDITVKHKFADIPAASA